MVSEQQLRKALRWASFEAEGQKRYAKALGVSAAVLSAFLSGKRKPSKNLLKAVGYEAVTVYRRIGEPAASRASKEAE